MQQKITVLACDIMNIREVLCVILLGHKSKYFLPAAVFTVLYSRSSPKSQHPSLSHQTVRFIKVWFQGCKHFTWKQFQQFQVNLFKCQTKVPDLAELLWTFGPCDIVEGCCHSFACWSAGGRKANSQQGKLLLFGILFHHPSLSLRQQC